MERLDTLPNGMFIWQSTDEFKFTMDAVLLAAFPLLKKKMKVADLGAGTGAVSMLAAAREDIDMTSIEINHAVAELLRKSVWENGLENNIKVLEEDIRDVKHSFVSGSYELVLTNPPYRKVGHGRMRSGGAEMACHETMATTGDFIRAARWLLKYSGKFIIVHLPERLPEIIHECMENHLEPKRLQMVYSYKESVPTAFLLEAVYGAKPGLKVQPAFFVYEEKDVYSEQLLAVYDCFKRK